MICPKCKVDQAHRSHRRDLLERLVAVLAIYPYRCGACQHRFLRFRYSEFLHPEPASGAEREVRATRRSIKWKRKRRELLLYGTGFALFLAFLYYLTRPRDSSSDGN